MNQMPVFVSQPGAQPPERGTYYAVGRNGTFIHLRNDWVDAVVPVEDFGALEPVPVQATLKLPPIDAITFAKAVAFFRKIYELHSAEAAVLLFYSVEKGWAFTVPQQRVSAAFVRWKDNDLRASRLEGYRCVGSMHSHGFMEASHSPTDVEDEAAIDGVHITIGNIPMYPNFSMSGELVVRGTRFALGERFTEGVSNLNTTQVAHGEETAVLHPRPTSHFYSGRFSRYSHDPSVIEGWEVPQEWLDEVTSSGYLSRHRTRVGEVAAPAVTDPLNAPLGPIEPYRDAPALPDVRLTGVALGYYTGGMWCIKKYQETIQWISWKYQAVVNSVFLFRLGQTLRWIFQLCKERVQWKSKKSSSSASVGSASGSQNHSADSLPTSIPKLP